MDVYIQNTNKCNRRCKVCNAGHSQNNNEEFKYIDMISFKKILEDLKSYQEDVYVILGAACEPTIDPTFKEKIELIKKYNYYSVVFSNGILVERLNQQCNPDLWIISILGGLGDEFNYEKITQLNLSETINIIKRLSLSKLIGVSLTIDPKDISICYLLKLQSFNNIGFILSTPTDYELDEHDILNFKEAQNILNSFSIIPKTNLEKRFFTACRCETNDPSNKSIECSDFPGLAIDINLNVIFCQDVDNSETKKLNFVIGNVGNTNLKQLHNKQLKIKNHIHQCNFNSCEKCLREANIINELIY